MKILVIDIGGSHVKFSIWGKREKREFVSGRGLTAGTMVRRVLAATREWKFDAVSIGYPGPVIHGQPAGDPPNLGKGWTRFNFEKHFGKPVKIINDAAMQALGSYTGGRMLFIGLGTGLGSSLILDNVVIPLELGELAYSKGRTLVDVLAKNALKMNGPARWEHAVHRVSRHLGAAFRTDYIVLGGGMAKHLKKLPPGARRGSNGKAFTGGARLWGKGNYHAKPRKHTWVIA